MAVRPDIFKITDRSLLTDEEISVLNQARTALLEGKTLVQHPNKRQPGPCWLGGGVRAVPAKERTGDSRNHRHFFCVCRQLPSRIRVRCGFCGGRERGLVLFSPPPHVL